MRSSEADRTRLAKKRVERGEYIAQLNKRLVNANSRVLIGMYGSSVTFRHMDFIEPGNDKDEYLVLDLWSDEEWDEAVLADSTVPIGYALAMSRAIERAQPVIEEKAVADFKRKFKELMA